MLANVLPDEFYGYYGPIRPEPTGESPFFVDDFMSNYEGMLTNERAQIVSRLAQHPWFQRTSPALQHELVTLPQTGAENHDGFLADLADRPDVISGAPVVGLAELPRGQFALLPIFTINNRGKEQPYTYISWRGGPASGAKGVVFVRPFAGAEPTHFITLMGESFAPASVVNDCVGGFADLGAEGVQTMLDRIHVEIEEEIGVSAVEEVVDLGSILTDRGMTNNRPQLFSAFISTTETDKINSHQINSDAAELQSGALILPMQYLRQFILQNTDALFQSIMLRAMAHGVVAAEWILRDMQNPRNS